MELSTSTKVMDEALKTQRYVRNERWENCNWTTILDCLKISIVHSVQD